MIKKDTATTNVNAISTVGNNISATINTADITAMKKALMKLNSKTAIQWFLCLRNSYISITSFRSSKKFLARKILYEKFEQK